MAGLHEPLAGSSERPRRPNGIPTPPKGGRDIQSRRSGTGRLGDRLVEAGLITTAQLNVALERQKTGAGPLGEVVVGLGLVTPEELRPYIEAVTGFGFVDAAEMDVNSAIATLVPEAFVSKHLALPIREEDGRVVVAMADPLNLPIVDELRTIVGKPISPKLALAPDLREAIRRTFDMRRLAQAAIESIPTANLTEAESSVERLLEQAEEAPIVRLVDSILMGAIAAGASDVHIEPQDGSVQVRYRIDGVLYDQMTVPPRHVPAIASRLKVMGRLDIAERRRPQDGRFTMADRGEREFDVRLSLMPTVYGEKAVMRLLEKSNTLVSLERLGLFAEQQAMLEGFLRRPYGLVFVVGPTGCGKTTTLYAALEKINKRTINVNTIEDPVEYKLAGVNQVQVNPKIGLTFATGLRTMVRQDPDVILVGEVRDRETAEMAIQSALTGHLVLSTLHTNDAPSAIVRLMNMGIEPYLIGSTLIGVVGQRLLHTICPNCRTSFPLSQVEADSLGLGRNVHIPFVSRGTGCRRCGDRGFRGRTGAFELMPISDELRNMVLRCESASHLTNQAIAEGMVSMREAAIRKVADQWVPPEEVMRVFAEEPASM